MKMTVMVRVDYDNHDNNNAAAAAADGGDEDYDDRD